MMISNIAQFHRIKGENMRSFRRFILCKCSDSFIKVLYNEIKELLLMLESVERSGTVLLLPLLVLGQ